jgi:hypothetical protein
MPGSLKEDLLVQLGSIIEEASSKPLLPEEPVPKHTVRRTHQLSREESFSRLDPFLEEAKAGAPDDWLARKAGVSLEVVLWWRKEKGVVRRRGPQRAREEVVWAAGFGMDYDPKLHSAGSDLSGEWSAPEYLLRKPLKYREFCRLVYALHVQLAAGPELIATAFGVRIRDAELALMVWSRHLEANGVPCRCGEKIDPRYGRYCSVRCAEEER